MSEKNYNLWICGDDYLLVDYGQIRSIAAGVKSVLLKELITEQAMDGIIEMLPFNNSLLISFDPRKIDVKKLKQQVEEMMDQEVEKRDDIRIHSRIIEIPVLFADPWTKQAWEEYCRTVKEKTYDVEQIIQENKLKDLDELIRYVTTPEYMITYLSLGPGLPSCTCLDPNYVLSVPKYNPPRLSTPAHTIGMGGSNISLYSTASPGGYQMFGMVAPPLLDLQQLLSDFAETPVLARVGDRFRFRSVEMDEFDAIRAECKEGKYRFNIQQDAMFSMSEYEKKISLEPKKVKRGLFSRGGER